MSIIDLKGNTLDAAHKREHDSDRVNARREHLNAVFVRMTQEWARDNATDPSGATQPNEPAIDQHYAKKWTDQAVAVLNSSDPVDVDPEAMAKWIAREREAKRKKAERNQPLHAVNDLRKYGLELAGMNEHQTRLWVSTECAVALHVGGMVHVWVRMVGQAPDSWVANLYATMAHAHPLVASPDYTLGELLDLLACLRRERMALPDAAALDVVRKDLQPA